MNPAALLPHEKFCPDCEDGWVDVVHPRTSSTAEEPFLATGRRERCETCDGTHVVLKEDRRSHVRPDGPAWTEVKRVSMECSLRGETIARLEREAEALRKIIAHDERHIDALLAENRRYRDAIHKAARGIERTARERVGRGV